MYQLSKTYIIDLSPTIVFNAWISYGSLIDPIYKIEINPIPGGEYKFYSDFNGQKGCIYGKFIDIKADRKLVYTWNWEGHSNETLVKVLFIEIEDKTEVHLSHEFFDTKESRDNHAQGWDHYVTELLKLISNKD